MISSLERVSRQRGAVSENRRCRKRPAAIAIAVLCASLAILATDATSAIANRTLASQMPGGTSVSFDANDNVWLTDEGSSGDEPGHGGLNEYDAYPSQTLLAEPNTFTPWGFSILDLQAAVDQASNEVFVAQSNGRTVDIFKNDVYSHSWTAINGVMPCFSCSGSIHVAIDNTNTYSGGRVYLSLTEPENDVEAFDAAQRPVDFPATANYISNNKLSGTPSGPFGDVGHVAVDAAGNIYVTDVGDGVVDEFDSAGTFVRTLPCPGCSAGNPVGTGGVGVDPTNGNILVGNGGEIAEYDSSGNFLEALSDGGAPSVNSQGYLYSSSGSIYTPTKVVPEVTYRAVSSPTTTSATLNATVDLHGGPNITECKFEYGEEVGSYNLGSKPCETEPHSSLPYTAATEVSAKVSSLTAGTTYHYRIVVESANGVKYGADQTYTTGPIPGLSSDAAANLTESGATLNGFFVGSGEETSYYFEWGLSEAYGEKTTEERISPGAGAGAQLSSQLTELAPYSTYHYRVVATNGAGTSYGQDRTFTTTPGIPTDQPPAVTAVHSDRAVFDGQVNPNGAATTVHFEYVDDATFQQSGWADAMKTSPDIDVGMSKHYQSPSQLVDGLTPGTVYHFRVVGTNEAGSASAAGTFLTFGFTPSLTDPCPNAHVRQQTGAALLLDCRAYELVSAANSGGYNVESNLVPGQTPFGGYPNAENPPQVLYGVHNGAIPGTGHPTNHGVDPYVTTRGENGWSTKYVGIPADDPFASAPFASTLAEADPGLDTFAFGGPAICSPCFEDHSTGIPVHKPNGELVQGMAGSENPGPSAKPEGFIGKRLSADGTHLVFGSKSKFEPGANEGEVSIYDRNLNTEETHVVSNTPTGQTMKEEGTEIGELDISKDGSRIVIGHLVEESEGTKYWHLYMDIGDSEKTIDLTPGTTHGVLFDGMTEDGSKVFFSTVDHLTDQEAEHSGADIFEAEISEAGTATLHLVSKGQEETHGAPGDTASCHPIVNWNTVSGGPNCSAVAIGGGGGVASGDGAIYFLSPELLDGPTHGEENQPNLYLDRPGSAPQFIATIDSSLGKPPPPPPRRSFLRTIGSFTDPWAITIDSLDDVWVADPGNSGLISKYDQYPSKTKVGEKAGEGHFGPLVHSIAIDHSNGNLLVADSGPDVVDVFEHGTGAFVERIEHGFGGGYVYVAADNSDSPSSGRFYVSGTNVGSVQAFDENGAEHAFSDTGASYISGNAITGTPSGPFGEVWTMTTDSSGDIYVVDIGKKDIDEFESSGAFVRTFTGIGAPGGFSSNLGGVAVDPTNGDVLVVDSAKNVVDEFDSSGTYISQLTGTAPGSPFGALTGGIAVNSKGYVYVADGGHGVVDAFSPLPPPPSPITNSAVIDAVNQPEARNTADFQVGASGNDAVFTSTLPLTGYDNAFHSEVFRYDAASETLECASCNPTSEQATGEATLATNGSSLTEDGRVFFNSTEGLVDRDLNENQDVYEWEPQGFKFEMEHEKFQTCETTGGCVQLISTGTSPFDSSLLGVSADGTDVYFFTHDSLVSSDQNGSLVKIYDARSLGGFDQVPPPHQCQASDECHGSGSAMPPPPIIRTVVGTPVGNATPSPNSRKHRHHHRRRHHRKAHHKRAVHHTRGGAK